MHPPQDTFFVARASVVDTLAVNPPNARRGDPAGGNVTANKGQQIRCTVQAQAKGVAAKMSHAEGNIPQQRAWLETMETWVRFVRV